MYNYSANDYRIEKRLREIEREMNDFHVSSWRYYKLKEEKEILEKQLK